MSKLENVSTLEELADHFQSKLTRIRQCVELRDAGADPAVRSMMCSVGQSLTDLGTILTVMRAELEQRRKAINSVQEMKIMVATLQERTDHAKENIPARMPKKTSPRTQPPTSKENIQPEHNLPPTPRKPLTETSQNIKPKQKPAKPGKPRNIPSIDFLTVEEFDTVPKYMKGRLTYDKVNEAVDELNKAFSGKYTLLATKRSAQTDFIKNKMITYKEQETKDTKGVQFIGDKDIKEYSTLKVDSACRSLLTIIRHCGRIKEIRGGGMTRYATCR